MPIHLDGMHILLGAILAVLVVILWHAHHNQNIAFNLFDLLMDDGKVSRTGVAFMLTLGVTTWVIVDLAIDERLTEAYLTIYCTSWVAPLVARVIFNKLELPGKTGAV